MALVTLLLSLLLWLFYSWTDLNRQFPFALGMEFWPYLILIPGLGLGLRLMQSKLRRQRLQLALAALLLALNATPYLHWLGIPSFKQRPEGLSIMSYNIWAKNSDYPAIEQSIEREKPDILFVTEVSEQAMEALKTRLNYPYYSRSPIGANAFFSHYPILSAVPDYPNVTDHGRTFSLVAKLQIADEAVTVIGFHPPIPLSRSSFTVRNQQFERLAPYLRQLRGRVIILGDFNTSPWSSYFHWFEQEAHLVSATQGHWIWATWCYQSAWPHLLAKLPIDHVEVRGFKSMGAWAGSANGSDHRPIIAVLQPA